MATGEDITLNIRTRGGRQAAREAGIAAAGVRGIGTAARRAGSGIDSLGRKMVSSPLRFFGQQARYAAFGLEALGVGAVGMGLKFNATMEQNQVAFTHFLGSERAAREELDTLFEIAAKTPFQFTDVTQATRKFLAFGFSIKESNSWMTSLGDAIAGAGLDAEAIDRAGLALGQIRSKGKLMSQDLRQLQELGVIDFAHLAKNLGISAHELANVGEEGITASKALPAIQKTIDDKFKGAAAEQAKTFKGQISTLRDYTSQTLGAITFPAFEKLRKDVFPALTKDTKEISEVFNRKDLTFAEKWDRSTAILKRDMGPIVKDLEDDFRHMKLGEKLSGALEDAIPQILETTGRMGGKALVAFAKGWWHAGPWGKLFGLFLVASRLGVFSRLGNTAADRFSTSFKARAGAGNYAGLGRKIGLAIGAAAALAIAYEVAKEATKLIGGGPIDIAKNSIDAGIAADTNSIVRRGRALGRDSVNRRAISRWQRKHPGVDAGRLIERDPRKAAEMGYPSLIPGAPGVPRGYRPTVSRATARAMHINVYIDGKGVAHHIAVTHGPTVAKGVNRVNDDKKARR